MQRMIKIEGKTDHVGYEILYILQSKLNQFQIQSGRVASAGHMTLASAVPGLFLSLVAVVHHLRREHQDLA